MGAQQTKKFVRVGKMVSDEVAQDVAQVTWESSSAYKEEQRRWANPEVGDKMPDGTIFAGISPYTGKQMFAMPQDVNVGMDFNQAAEYAGTLNAYGHKDWRLPSKEELSVLFNNRAAIGGFNETGLVPPSRGTSSAACYYLTGTAPAGYYWSSTRDFGVWVCAQRFSDGNQDGLHFTDDGLSVRYIRLKSVKPAPSHRWLSCFRRSEK